MHVHVHVRNCSVGWSEKQCVCVCDRETMHVHVRIYSVCLWGGVGERILVDCMGVRDCRCTCVAGHGKMMLL